MEKFCGYFQKWIALSAEISDAFLGWGDGRFFSGHPLSHLLGVRRLDRNSGWLS
jgi:hypothetical protein